MAIIINENISQIKWNFFIEKNHFSSPFQTHEFYKFFNSIPGLSADAFAVEENDEFKSLCVVTIQKEKGIKGYFSRRGIIYGGPLIEEAYSESLSVLLDDIISHYKSALIYIEIRNYFDYTPFKNVFITAGFNYVSWLNFQLKIRDHNEIKMVMSNTRQRQVKKAQQDGVYWKEAEDLKEVNSFYEILLNLYNRKVKKPLFPKDFFIEFYLQKIGKFLLIYKQNKVIGGIMCPVMPNKAIYELYICGLDQEYKDQYPSVMATWAAIDYASRNNIPVFDFMGAGRKDRDYGVREFKARFGGELVEYGRYLKIINPLLYNVGNLGLKVLSIVKR